MSLRTNNVVRLGGVCVLAAAVGAGSWFIAAAATDDDRDHLEPRKVEPSLVTAAVERRVVTSTISGRATIGFTNLIDVTAPAEGGRVTRDPLPEGTEVGEGDVLAEVDGRPTVALTGTTPMYRALTIGLSGPDVEQFEAAVARMGIDPGPVDGVFDEATEKAVASYYRQLGSEATEPTAEQRAAYNSAKDAVTQAQLKVLSDRHALDLDRRGPDTSTRAQLDNAVAAAHVALDKAQRDQVALIAELDATDQARAGDVDRAKGVVASVQHQVDELPPSTSVTERAQLTAQLNEAQAALDTAQNAADEFDRSRPNKLADGQEAIATALRTIKEAELARSDALISDERTLLAENLRVSEQAVIDAQARLEDQAIAVSAAVPASEVVFVPSFPRKIQTVIVEKGDAAVGTLLRLSGGDPVGRWFVSATEKERLSVGQDVTLTRSGGAATHPGKILSIADEPGDPQADEGTTGGDPSDSTGATGSGGASPGSATATANGFLVEVSVGTGTDGTLPGTLVGSDLQVTAPLDASDGPQLSVPLAAITSNDDGTSKVVVAVEGQRTRDVTVTVVRSGGGFAEIRPTDGVLDEDDRVVVGS